MKKKFPNLFIIGAPKCGTTSIAHWLSGHPQIYFYVGRGKDTKVEPHYWATDFESYQRMTKKEYFEIFRNIDEKKYRYAGEASVWYLFSETAIKNIESNIKEPKYIVCIRNPVEMAYSLWLHRIKEGVELIKDDFIKAFRLSFERSKGNLVGVNRKLLKFISSFNGKSLDYKAACSLGSQLKRLFNIVPKERVLVLVLDDIKANPRREWLKILNFLELEDDGRKVFPVYNKKRVPRNDMLYQIYVKFLELNAKTYKIREQVGLTGLGIMNIIKNIALSDSNRMSLKPKEKEELLKYFLPEIEKLEELLGRNFDEWKR